MAEKLTRLQKMKAKNPKRFAEYMALKKRTGRTSKDAARKTIDKISARGGTPAEARALRAGEKAAKAALDAGKTVKQANAIGEKTSRGQMKTNRSKTNVEAAWAAASAIPVGGLIVRGVRAAKAAGEGIKKLTGATVKKKATQKAAADAKKIAAAAVKKTKSVKGFLPQSQKAKKVNRAAATAEAKRKAAKTAKEKATATVTAGQKAVTAANVAGRKPLSTADRLRIGATGGIAAINIARQKAKKPKKVAAKPLPAKPKPSPVKRTPAPVTIGDEERVGSSSPGKTITSNPKGEGSSTGLDLETILERIEEREYPTDPDDPGAFDLDDLKADLKELRGYKHGGKVKGYKKGGSIKKHGGKVKRNMGGSVRGVGAARQGFGKAKYSDKLY